VSIKHNIISILRDIKRHIANDPSITFVSTRVCCNPLGNELHSLRHFSRAMKYIAHLNLMDAL